MTDYTIVEQIESDEMLNMGEFNEELVKKYPKYTNDIVRMCLDLYILLTTSNIKLLQQYGWDINEKFEYPTDSDEECTSLESALELRHFQTIRSLLECGVNIPENTRIPLAEILIMGHSSGCELEFDQILEGFDIFKTYSIPDYVSPDFFEKYFGQDVIEKWIQNVPTLYEYITNTSQLTKSATK